MKRPCRIASQKSKIKTRELFHIPLKSFNMNGIRTINTRLPLILILFLLFIFNSEAQQTQISKSVFGSGGGKMISSGYMLNGTVGQTLIGSSNNNSVKAESGFWNKNMGPITSVNDFSFNTGTD